MSEPPGATEQHAVAAAKRAVRARLRAARSGRPRSERRDAARRLRVQCETASWADAVTVAAYVPSAEEPGDPDLLDVLVGRGCRVLLPITTSRVEPLRWGWYAGPGDLLDGPAGVRQPATADAGAGPEQVDLVLAPALAVDRSGYRLGKGAGHYDRALVAVAPPRVTAVVFDDEVLDALPHEAHDRPVGWVLTPGAGRQQVRR